MPVHDWSGIEAGIFHDFHHAWIEEIKRALNAGILPGDYYALSEQHAAGFGPDVLTLQSDVLERNGEVRQDVSSGNGGLLLAPPRQPITAETDLEFYRRKQNEVAVRHVSDDRIVAIVEIVSPGNKSSQNALRSFVWKAERFLEQQIHLLIVDVHAPGPRDPQGIHAAIWEDFAGQSYFPPAGKPFTLASYEADLGVRCIVEHAAVGDALPDMPLFLQLNGQVPAPLELTYCAAVEAMPRRWRRVLEGK
jgi:Protein of unknown function (DUF4058)